jgi:hypothetical protein
VASKNDRWSRVGGRFQEPIHWLLAVGVVAIGLSLYLSSERLVTYSQEIQSVLALYIALQVIGWLSLIEWMRANYL